MQPVNDNLLQQQIIPAQQKTFGQKGIAQESVKTPSRIATSGFPEDVVNLSTDRSSIQDAPVKKKPSIPVSLAERKALKDSFSVYA